MGRGGDGKRHAREVVRILEQQLLRAEGREDGLLHVLRGRAEGLDELLVAVLDQLQEHVPDKGQSIVR